MTRKPWMTLAPPAHVCDRLVQDERANVVTGIRTGNGPSSAGQDRRLPSGFFKDRASCPAGVHPFQSSGRVVGAPSK